MVSRMSAGHAAYQGQSLVGVTMHLLLEIKPSLLELAKAFEDRLSGWPR